MRLLRKACGTQFGRSVCLYDAHVPVIRCPTRPIDEGMTSLKILTLGGSPIYLAHCSRRKMTLLLCASTSYVPQNTTAPECNGARLSNVTSERATCLRQTIYASASATRCVRSENRCRRPRVSSPGGEGNKNTKNTRATIVYLTINNPLHYANEHVTRAIRRHWIASH